MSMIAPICTYMDQIVKLGIRVADKRVKAQQGKD